MSDFPEANWFESRGKDLGSGLDITPVLKLTNNSSIALFRVSCSQNSHTVSASGTASSNPSPKKRMNDSQSCIWSSVGLFDSV